MHRRATGCTPIRPGIRSASAGASPTRTPCAPSYAACRRPDRLLTASCRRHDATCVRARAHPPAERDGLQFSTTPVGTLGEPRHRRSAVRTLEGEPGHRRDLRRKSLRRGPSHFVDNDILTTTSAPTGHGRGRRPCCGHRRGAAVMPSLMSRGAEAGGCLVADADEDRPETSRFVQCLRRERRGISPSGHRSPASPSSHPVPSQRASELPSATGGDPRTPARSRRRPSPPTPCRSTSRRSRGRGTAARAPTGPSP